MVRDCLTSDPKTTKEVATELGISREEALRALKYSRRYGVNRHRVRGNLIEWSVTEVIEKNKTEARWELAAAHLTEEPQTAKAIADKIGISDCQVRSVLKYAKRYGAKSKRLPQNQVGYYLPKGGLKK